MRIALAATGMVATLASHALGQNGTVAAESGSAEDRAVLRRERDLLGAYTRGDARALDRMFADGITYTSPGGFVMGRQGLLADAKPNGGVTYDVASARARVYGETAVVTGVLTAAFKQGDKEATQFFRFTDTFVRKANDWQLAASQHMRIPVWQAREMEDRELAAAAAVDCGQEPSLKSLNSDVATYLRFSNATAGPVVVHWINYDGKRDPAVEQMMTIRPGRSDFRYTYVTHPFVATDSSGRCLGVYQPARDPSLAVIR